MDEREDSHSEDCIDFNMSGISDTENPSLNDEDGEKSIVDFLTYVPGQGTTDRNQTSTPDPGDGSRSWTRGASYVYSIRQLLPVDYSCTALPEFITTSDEPSVKEALESPERYKWLDEMNEEF